MPSVLVIDDDEQVRRMIRDSLEAAGYCVEEARNGAEGLQRYRASPADVVLMDILMPDQDGLEGILAFRQEFPSARVIAMTGGSDLIGIMNFLEVAKMLGARRTIQKPFELETLLAAVASEVDA
jgi:CheY-like chemotaxis protein